MRFDIDEPVGSTCINIIRAFFWLIRILLLGSIIFFCFSFGFFVFELIKADTIYSYCRDLVQGAESIDQVWLLLPAWWVVGWCLQIILKPWAKKVNIEQLCKLFQNINNCQAVETYLTKVSHDKRMISLKEYIYLDRMVKNQVKLKYWALGKE
ncbi:MAG: hypothetical protein OCC45_12370 [Desulfotalea sp.]